MARRSLLKRLCTPGAVFVLLLAAVAGLLIAFFLAVLMPAIGRLLPLPDISPSPLPAITTPSIPQPFPSWPLGDDGHDDWPDQTVRPDLMAQPTKPGGDLP